jgi:hypothetical protein
MRPSEAKEMMPIFEAFAEGKTVEFRDSVHQEWMDAQELSFCYPADCYRIKPTVLRYKRYIRDETTPYVDTWIPSQEACNEAPRGLLRWIDTEWQEVEL